MKPILITLAALVALAGCSSPQQPVNSPTSSAPSTTPSSPPSDLAASTSPATTSAVKQVGDSLTVERFSLDTHFGKYSKSVKVDLKIAASDRSGEIALSGVAPAPLKNIWPVQGTLTSADAASEIVLENSKTWWIKRNDRWVIISDSAEDASYKTPIRATSLLFALMKSAMKPTVLSKVGPEKLGEVDTTHYTGKSKHGDGSFEVWVAADGAICKQIIKDATDSTLSILSLSYSNDSVTIKAPQ